MACVAICPRLWGGRQADLKRRSPSRGEHLPRPKDGRDEAGCLTVTRRADAHVRSSEADTEPVKHALCVLAIVVTASCGSGSTSLEVHPDGRIGPLQIDVSSEADVRRFAGKPFKVEKVFSEAKKDPVGYELNYRCGRDCVTSYAISYATGKLSDFHTQSPRFVTERGSRVGASANRAAGAERRKIVGGCGEGHYFHLRWDEHHIFVLGVFEQKVSLIAYLGPHTLSYEGLC